MNKRAGLGPGARHGMSAGAVRHLPASTRNVRTADGSLVTIDELCRSCGYEQPPNWNGLRCQNCRLPLNQPSSIACVTAASSSHPSRGPQMDSIF